MYWNETTYWILGGQTNKVWEYDLAFNPIANYFINDTSTTDYTSPSSIFLKNSTWYIASKNQPAIFIYNYSWDYQERINLSLVGLGEIYYDDPYWYVLSDDLNTIFLYEIDNIYPTFSNQSDNNGTLYNNGTGLFYVNVDNTNGTVFLHINNTNYTVSHPSSCYQETANVSTACGGREERKLFGKGETEKVRELYQIDTLACEDCRAYVS